VLVVKKWANESPTKVFGVDLYMGIQSGQGSQIYGNTKMFYLFMKRTVDIVLSVLALILTCVFFIFVPIIIKIDSKGSAIYKQERLKKDGKPFMVYKFRSMRIDAEKDGAQWASSNDDRVTGVGKFIRKTRIDELPQLFNILRGDMSIVGPRPERAVFYDEFEKTIPNFRNRLAVKPGLTGWAQVNGGYDLAPSEKLVYDLEYIQNQSFYFDLKCIIKTVSVIFTHEGAR